LRDRAAKKRAGTHPQVVKTAHGYVPVRNHISKPEVRVLAQREKCNLNEKIWKLGRLGELDRETFISDL
jgi:hypothetical protein